MEQQEQNPGRSHTPKSKGRPRKAFHRVTFRCPEEIYAELGRNGSMTDTIVYALRAFFGFGHKSGAQEVDDED